ncbi:MAG TPA: type II toxin-antitoxin system VapC family toxin [Patescibacteria group bacterium]
MKKVIIDASVWLAHILPDEDTSKKEEQVFEEFYNKQLTVLAPPLLKLELANGLSSAVKSQRLLWYGADELLDFFLQLHLEYIDVELSKALHLSTDYNLSVYDAMYLALAQDFSAELITDDKKLRALIS